jgi:hypothetical protein
MLEQWLFPQLEENMKNGAPPHWHCDVRSLMRDSLMVGLAAVLWMTYSSSPKGAPCSPDLTVSDYFLWRYKNDRVYIPPLAQILPELRERLA